MRPAVVGLSAALLLVLGLLWLSGTAASCRGEADDMARKARLCERALAWNAALPLPGQRVAVLEAHRGAALAERGEDAAAAEAMDRAIDLTNSATGPVAAITVDLLDQPGAAQVAWAMARRRAGVR